MGFMCNPTQSIATLELSSRLSAPPWLYALQAKGLYTIMENDEDEDEEAVLAFQLAFVEEF